MNIVAGGYRHTLTIDDEGYVWGSGNNSNFEIGRQTKAEQNLLVERIDGLERAVSVAAGDSFSLVLIGNGEVWSFGSNEYGQLGHGGIASSLPKQIPSLCSIVSISCGVTHAMCINEQREVYAMGRNLYGQLGLGDTKKRDTPVLIPNLSDILQVQCGETHSIFLTYSGVVYSTGTSTYGQLGLTGSSLHKTPEPIPDIPNTIKIVCGVDHSLLLSSEGDLYTFGRNSLGQLGTGDTLNQRTPQKIDLSFIGEEIRELAAGNNHSMLLTTGGTVYASGSNDYGIIGDTNVKGYTPKFQLIHNLDNVILMENGVNHAIFKIEDEVWGLGRNYNGQLGSGDSNQKNEPIQIKSSHNYIAHPNRNFAKVKSARK